MCEFSRDYECKEDDIGKDYRGKVSTTSSGFTCQAWVTNVPHEHNWHNKPTAFPEGNLQDASNYCRNPDSDVGGPWCYTTIQWERWDYCSVGRCDEECLEDIRGRNYKGKISITSSGKTCQSWTSQSPHEHKLVSGTGFPSNDRAGSQNYCRNPGRNGDAGGPWCYTTDPKTRWEYCHIKLCTHN
eukprot:GHVU01162325.1.p1 GENE.GHVU01162325.1~~GHVU01162325.1.p1  ORF type:complete len:185 (+),score=6.91 GHVU01162325.1:122-676(+)